MNAPEPCEKEVDICMFVDSDHAGDNNVYVLFYLYLVLMKKSNLSPLEISML